MPSKEDDKIEDFASNVEQKEARSESQRRSSKNEQASQPAKDASSVPTGFDRVQKAITDFHDSVKEWNQQSRQLSIILVVIALIQTAEIVGVFSEPKEVREYFSYLFDLGRNPCANPWAYVYSYYGRCYSCMHKTYPHRFY